jgi:GMP synthase-like glutamine amidotransferase
MSKAVILQHAEHLGPGRIIPVFRDYGIPIDLRRLDRGDEVPSDLDAIRVLVVLGGRMSVWDVEGTEPPYLNKELELVTRMIAADRAVLGISFGAQLLAHAAGARVYLNAKPGATPDAAPTPLPEYGWGPVTFPFPGGTEPIVFGCADGSPMFHWHSQTFDLPKLPPPANPAPPPAPPPPTGNALISSTRTCKNQAFRFETRLFGFQYHIELTEDGIAAMLASASDAARQALGTDGQSRINEQTPRLYPRYARLGERILRNFVQFLKAY